MPRDEPKNFDIKVGKVVPPSTSKPIIPGHHPIMPDPMLSRPMPPVKPIKIEITDQHGASEPAAAPAPVPADHEVALHSKKIIAVPSHPDLPPAKEPHIEPAVPEKPAEKPLPAPAEQAAPVQPEAEKPESAAPAEDMKVHLPAGEAARAKSKTVWLAAAAAVITGLAVGYLVVK